MHLPSGRAVVIAGAGPTGLMPAGELALAGVDVAIVERRADQDLIGSRAQGFSARTIEVLDQRGIVDRFISQAWLGQIGGFSGIPLDIGDFPTRHNYGLRSAAWIFRFTDLARQAASYRAGRVLLAGDAAHVHSPMGGQGLSVGIQDAVNLGWKLAQVVSGTSPEISLDTYHAERHPVAARVLRNTMAQVALSGAGERVEALRDTMSELLSLDQPRKQIAGMMCGLDIHYDLGPGRPLLGRRMPDLDLVTAAGPLRVFTLLHAARPVLLNLGEPGGFDIAPWANRVQLVDAECADPWELPAIGAVTAPAAVLIRPDGHVAWVADPGGPGLADALTTWFGPPSAA